MIQSLTDDIISFGLWLISLMIAIYLSLFTQLSTLIIIPIILGLSGIVIQLSLSKQITHDEDLTVAESGEILRFTILALAVMTIASAVMPYVFLPSIQLSTYPMQLSVTPFDSLLYSQLYAISEERFFRGGINTFFIWKLKNPVLCSVIGGTTFSVYHFAVYGTSIASLSVVFVAGLVLSYVTYRTNRLSAATLAHCGNNIFATVLRTISGGIA